MAWPYKSYSENVLFIEKSSFLLLGIDQTKFVVVMTKEGFTKIENFMTPGAGFLVLGHGHIENCIISLTIFFSTPRHRSDKPSIYL